MVGPVSDVSALVQDMLTSVAGAGVPLTQLQSDLYSFLLGIAGVAPVSDVIALVQDMLSRLPVRSSCSRNCPPSFPPSCWASPGCSP